MRPDNCDRPSLQHAAVVAAGLSVPVVATAVVPLDVTGIVITVVVVVVVVLAGAEVVTAVIAPTVDVVIVVVLAPVPSDVAESRKTPRWPRAWRPVATTLLTRVHLPPRGDIAFLFA